VLGKADQRGRLEGHLLRPVSVLAANARGLNRNFPGWVLGVLAGASPPRWVGPIHKGVCRLKACGE
jgi:hypothetical protein